MAIKRKFPQHSPICRLLVFAGAVQLFFWVGACGPQGSNGFQGSPVQVAEDSGLTFSALDAENLVEAVIPLVPAIAQVNREELQAGVQSQVLLFSEPEIEVKGSSQEVEFRVVLETEDGQVPVRLSGHLDENGRVNLEEESLEGQSSHIRAIGQCTNMENCDSLYVDVLYRENGKQRRKQFLRTIDQGQVVLKEKTPDKNTSTQGESSQVVKAERCDEFNGCQGEFVGHRVEQSYYSGLKDWGKGLSTETSPPLEKKESTGTGGDKPLEGVDLDNSGPVVSEVVDSPKELETIIGLEMDDLTLGAHSVGLPYKNGSIVEANLGPNFLALEGGPGFEKINPKRNHHYGSGLLVKLLEKSAVEFRKSYDPNSNIYINALSKRKGGRLGRHSSHQSGLDADIAYLDKEKGWREVVDSKSQLAEDFDLERNFAYFKLLVETGYVNRIFVDKAVKLAMCQWAEKNKQMDQSKEVLTHLRPYKGHDDHFHLRLKCSPYYSRCRNQTAPTELGCS